MGGPIRVTAFGGGHGLGASLRALKLLRIRLALDITAVVTVGDDGGSSGRLRADRDVLPPGDLRQALAALADPGDPAAARTADLMQYRFAGVDSLAGHPVGNLMLAGLMEMCGDPVVALDHAATLVHAVGRVLPMSVQPVGIEATVHDIDPTRPDRATVLRGQHQVAITSGRVDDVRLVPAAPEPCKQVINAVESADWLIFGPGSWFTSVIPHLLVPDLAAAILASPARRLVTLNLAAELETAGMSLPDHLRALTRYLSGLRVDVVLADRNAVADVSVVGELAGLHGAAASLGARLLLAPVAMGDGSARHDPVTLADALHDVLGGADVIGAR